MDKLTVILPTYNPVKDILNRTLSGLKNQTLPQDLWSLIIVDNNSSNKFSIDLDLSWHVQSRLIQEHKQGLTYARLRGFNECREGIILLVDDDNILENNYLFEILEIFRKHPRMGAIGGKSIPYFLSEPPDWLRYFFHSLALRDLGDEIKIDEWQNKYPENAPIGAGMALRVSSLVSYKRKVSSNQRLVITDRLGTSLSSGGDNDIVLEIVKSGFQVGYFPSLVLRHIIPEERFSTNYQAKLAKDSNKSWMLLLSSHNINPWPSIAPWTIPFRKIKAWFAYKAWLNKVNYIKWRGACGAYDGLSENLGT